MRDAQFQAARKAAISFLMVAGLRWPPRYFFFARVSTCFCRSARRERLDREGLAEGPLEVPELDLGRLQAVRLEGAVAVGLEVAFDELAEAQLDRDGLVRLDHLAVVEDEILDLDAGGDPDELLLDPQEQVVDLRGLGLGFLVGNLAERQVVPLAAVEEGELVAAVPVLERGHGRPPEESNTNRARAAGLRQNFAKLPRAQE